MLQHGFVQSQGIFFGAGAPWEGRFRRTDGFCCLGGPDPIGIKHSHLAERGGNILHTVPDAHGQLPGHLGSQVLHVAHGGQSLIGEGTLDDTGYRQLRGHQLHGFSLHGVSIVQQIDLYPGRGLIDAPGAAGGLPQGKEVVTHAVEDQRCKGIEIQASFHTARIGDQYLKTTTELPLYPGLPLFRRDLGGKHLSGKAFGPQQMHQLVLGVCAGPAGVDQHFLTQGQFLPDNFQHRFLFGIYGLEIAVGFRLHQRYAI